MNFADEARYGRASLLILNVCPFTLRHVINDYHIKNGYTSLQDFLDKNKHDLYHILNRRCCYRLVQSRSTPMNRSQWDLLFIRNSSSCRTGYTGDCPCQYDAKPGVTSDVMDITLCCLFIKNICSRHGGINMAHIETIRTIRNHIIHAESAQLDLLTYNEYWNRIRFALLDLANNVSPTVHTDTLSNIQDLETRVMNAGELGEIRNVIVNEKRIEVVKERVTNVEKDHETIIKDNEQVKKTVKETAERVTQIEGRNTQTSEELKKLGDTVQKAAEHERGVQMSLSHSEGEIRKRVSHVEKDLEAASKDNEQVKKNVKETAEKVTQIEGCMAHVERDLEEASKDNEQVKKSVKETAEKVTQIEGSMVHVERDLEAASKNNEQVKTSVKETLEKVTQIEAQTTEELRKLGDTVQKTTEHERGVERRLSQSEETVGEQGLEMKEMKQKNSKLQEKLKETLKDKEIDFVDVWVAKRYQNDEEVLVVEVIHNKQFEKRSRLRSFENTPIVYLNAVTSCESLAISLKDNDTLRTFSKEEISDAERVLLQNRNKIMKNHSNVVEVEISGHKSKQYGTKGARCDIELTIAIQTRIKGFIPIEECMFPVKLEKYSTDIREAFVTSATHTPSDLHDPLKIGCSISTKGLQMHSTLGPFFKHPRKGILLSWSCAHGFIDPQHLTQNGIEQIVPQLIEKPVLQPHGDENEFGKVFDAKIQHGYKESGIDGTLIEIHSRFPDNGRFPEISKENTLSAGFSDCPTFQNGKIEKEVCKLIGKEVVMFGQKSGFQRGTVQLLRADIEANFVRTTYGDFRYELSQQIKVLPIPIHDPDIGIHFPSPFAELGDSGAPIFIRDGDDLAIVGILTCVGAQGVGYFTPITNFLNAFDINDIEFLYPFSGKPQHLNCLKCNLVSHKSLRSDKNSYCTDDQDKMDIT